MIPTDITEIKKKELLKSKTNKMKKEWMKYGKNPQNYVLFIDYPQTWELSHTKPKNTEYIYSSSEHFLEGDENKFLCYRAC